MTTATRDKRSSNKRELWTALVAGLLDQVEQWCKDRRWPVSRQEIFLDEEGLGRYAVPVLNILAPGGTLRLEPIGRNIAAADGRVDLYAFPSLQRVLLVRKADRWIVKTDSGITWPAKWSQKTFEDLVQNLTNP